MLLQKVLREWYTWNDERMGERKNGGGRERRESEKSDLKRV